MRYEKKYLEIIALETAFPNMDFVLVVFKSTSSAAFSLFSYRVATCNILDNTFQIYTIGYIFKGVAYKS